MLISIVFLLWAATASDEHARGNSSEVCVVVFSNLEYLFFAVETLRAARGAGAFAGDVELILGADVGDPAACPRPPSATGGGGGGGTLADALAALGARAWRPALTGDAVALPGRAARGADEPARAGFVFEKFLMLHPRWRRWPRC